ncbi:hypothetical protein [Sporolactobacillus nakayamae]|uniref:Uncharacterized protein n=1 Tax=Sporolactobacillus nakayamae TaxID=269670 RepID=A0A1I2N8E2_9BACL|nr:hypothetical protein [Sporolactobacillus nakayamae]SFF99748.1 hypothetical protein SAMN02982927_00338 [Sporolactobacillus nakayamae]
MSAKIKLSSVEIMINTNNQKLIDLRKYEEEHHNDLPAGPIYWAVVHEIEYLEKQNQELIN